MDEIMIDECISQGESSRLRYKISYDYILYKEQKINLKIEMNEAASAVLHIYTSFWDNAQF